MDEQMCTRRGHVLIVDDDEDIRDTLAEALSLMGYTSDSAVDGAEGLELLRKREVCLVILDLMMPGMNGWDFRKEQLREPALAHIPVAVLSGAGLAGARLEELAADVYLEKPVALDRLLQVTARFCDPARDSSSPLGA